MCPFTNLMLSLTPLNTESHENKRKNSWLVVCLWYVFISRNSCRLWTKNPCVRDYIRFDRLSSMKGSMGTSQQSPECDPSLSAAHMHHPPTMRKTLNCRPAALGHAVKYTWADPLTNGWARPTAEVIQVLHLSWRLSQIHTKAIGWGSAGLDSSLQHQPGWG